MSKLAEAFQNGKAFIPFVTAGDPNLSVTRELLLALAEAGADVIEVGIPFSDPIAEGPVIQRADGRALAAGTTTDHIFDMLETVDCPAALAVMTYMNPVFTYGTDRFMARCAAAGVEAVIVPDVPFEERQELLPHCERHGITPISMIAPTSRERIQTIAAQARGFLYCVSSLGVTGMRSDLGNDVGNMVRLAKAAGSVPCAVGFGVSTPDQARQMARVADGVIVGSAIVRMVEEEGAASVPRVARYAREMKRAMTEKE